MAACGAEWMGWQRQHCSGPQEHAGVSEPASSRTGHPIHLVG
jgi:hypothetical protein